MSNIEKVFKDGYQDGYLNATKDARKIFDGKKEKSLLEMEVEMQKAWDEHLLTNEEIKQA